MSISKQVKELRELANSKELEMHEPVTYGFYGKIKSKLFKAADTIEALSAKLQEANEEQKKKRPAEDCGGWIPCSERLPQDEKMVLLSLKNLDICVGFNADFEKRFQIVGYGYTNYENVLAWMLLPESYHEP